MKVVLGLSGGVDSAVSALLLRRAGCEVIGVYLDNGFPGAEAARESADALGIPFETVDIRGALERFVCAPFAEGYLRGETPSPCVLCNPSVKFRQLLLAADRVGAEYIATGHYARSENGHIFRGRNANDQSYMLCRLTQEQVRRLILPLGSYEKAQVREIAAEHGLSAAQRPDSMEICFIPDRDYAAYIERRGITPPPGSFLLDGQVVGKHRGIHHYTLGQRRRLGIALGERVYVSGIDPDANTVTLSRGDELRVSRIRVRDIVWLHPPAELPLHCDARIRHSRTLEKDAELSADGILHFSTPVRAPTPGQAAAFYSGEELLGGGFIQF